MKSMIACLLVLVAASNAQMYGFNNYGYGINYGYGFNYGYGLSGLDYGLNPLAGIRSVAPLPAALPAVYGLPAVTATKYHAQDELGQASFGYAYPGQAASNMRDAYGNQIGSYAYINPNGKQVQVAYTADHRGFRVASNDLPVSPIDTAVAPLPVQDTPEVAAAKAAHMNAVAAAKAAPSAPAAPSRSKRQVFAYGTSPLAVAPYINALNTPYGYTRYANTIGAPLAVSPFGYNIAAPSAVSPLAYNVVAPATPMREATLTRTVLNPGHAVSYRVD